MLKRTLVSLAVLVGMLVFSSPASAQGGEYSAYSPYSVYGVGELLQQGSAYNRTMGGVGVATRNNKYLNTLNPAAATARDSLSVLADFTAASCNKIFKQGDMKSASNVVNVTGLNVNLPIIKNMGVTLGIAPYAASGYSCSSKVTDYNLIGRTGGITFTQYGQGSLYEAHLALGYTLWKRLSIGAQLNYYFGYFEKNFNESFTETRYNGLTNEYLMSLNGFTGKFGIQYEQPFGNGVRICVGGTYQMKTMLSGIVENQIYASSLATDFIKDEVVSLNTLANRPSLAPEFVVGVALNIKDKIRAEFDYSRADWTGSYFYQTIGFKVSETLGGEYFSDSVAQSFRVGVEYTPNRNDVRYFYKRMSYRVGGYYNMESYNVSGNQIGSRGITLGVTIPIFRWYNGFSVAVDLGQRGTLKNNLVRENYINISCGVNLFDIWFQKHQYN